MMRTSSFMERRSWLREDWLPDKRFIGLLLMGALLTRTNILNNLTPFGIAFFSSFIIMKGSSPLLLVTMLGGTVIYHGRASLGYLLSFSLVYVFFNLLKKDNSYSLVRSSGICGIIFFLSRLFAILVGKNLFIYDLLIAVFESIVVFTMIYIFTFSFPLDSARGSNFNNEKIVCSFISLALVLAGVSGSLVNISMKNLLSIIIILYIAYNQGAFIAGGTGIILGMIAYISHREMPFIMSILGVSGLLAGIFKDLGISGPALGFLLGNGIISFYINGLGTSFLNVREMILGLIIFILTVEKVNKLVSRIFEVDINSKKDYIEKRDHLVVKKLDRMSALFENLSATFRESSEEREMESTNEIYGLVDNLANQFCKDCYKNKKCWQENYYKTYRQFVNLIGIREMKEGDNKYLYDEAKKFCLRYSAIVEAMDRAVDKMKLNQAWKLRLKENRYLLAEQLEGVGNIVRTMTKDIYSNVSFNSDVEKELYRELKNARIDVREVSVTQIGEEDYEIFLDLNSPVEDRNKLKVLVSKVLGFPVTTEGSFLSYGKSHRFKLIRHNRFSAISKIANRANFENQISGDSFTFGEVDNLYYTAISDGMGIGRRAREESKVAISLLEKLMEANMDKDLALRTINSVLRAKSNEEIFTTLDLSFIDLYSGKLQMIKTGAPATFIKRKDRVEKINSTSLPVGLLKDVEFNIYEEYVEDGDLIIMMSDGVLEADRSKADMEAWMEGLIMNIDSSNPQVMAREILKKAGQSANSKKDDMTVLVTKVWRNI